MGCNEYFRFVCLLDAQVTRITKKELLEKDILYFICSPSEKIRMKTKDILRNFRTESHDFYKEILEAGGPNEISSYIKSASSSLKILNHSLKFIPRLFTETSKIIKSSSNGNVVTDLLSGLWQLFTTILPLHVRFFTFMFFFSLF